ncbi:MAG: phage terminase small subunit [Rhizorhabdus sp.]
MSLARRRREEVSATIIASGSLSQEGGLDPAVRSGPAGTVAEEMRLRLTLDRRRLKELKATNLKVAAKRDMLPAYDGWIAGLLAAGQAAPGEEVLPTIMVWRIDVADYVGALDLAEHVLAHDIAMPAHFNRDAASVVVEEIAVAALKVQNIGASFPLDVLERVEALTDGRDMHDEIRAKLARAIGNELADAAEAIDPTTPAFTAPARRALDLLLQAQTLDDRVGVKGRITRLNKALAKAAPLAASDIAGTAG